VILSVILEDGSPPTATLKGEPDRKQSKLVRTIQNSQSKLVRIVNSQSKLVRIDNSQSKLIQTVLISQSISS
jgi:hypothetical protein